MIPGRAGKQGDGPPMDWNNYEFDNEPLPPEGGVWGKRLRLLLIFLVIAGVTAGLIYWLRPQESAPQEETVQPAPAETGEESDLPQEEGIPAPERETPLPLAPGPGTSLEIFDGRAPEEGEPAPPADDPQPVPQTKEEPANPPEDTPLNPATPPANLVPTVEPEKGKPWVGDPVQDGPVVVPNAAPVDKSAEIAAVREALSAGNYSEALNRAQQLIADPALTENSAAWREAAALLTRANLAAWENGVERKDYTVTYRARPGDSFSRVASRSKTTIEAIKRGNRIRPEENTLFLNQKLVLYPGPWRIRVEKAARLLKLYNCNPAHPEQLFAVFDVGIGRLGKTPTANFVISGRLKHPAWYTPNGGIIPYGDPENMLGDYFLKLAPASTPGKPLLGYGIHGTPDESSVTKSLSNGCIRMRNADVELLYILVPGRTPVEITE